ncbi:UNVERIFIED_CONTAM: hypothetical protein PYX00_009902 [Menopon gallinae]|uniref:DNA-binding protein RFX6 n=1 Tax=Menopon gallinae TaxID=328185 RepID=A0AAW2HD30_9NEOP
MIQSVRINDFAFKNVELTSLRNDINISASVSCEEALKPSVKIEHGHGSCINAHLISKELKTSEETTAVTLKPHSTPATLLWLDRNYELADGICIPRNTLYSHYVHFCRSNSMNPLNSASFGKIIRQAFPSLTTRRLGTRGQSRYHYYGIAIKNTSPFYDVAFSKMNANCPETKKLTDKNDKSITSTKNKGTSTVLPQFPNMKEISFPPHVSKDKVTSFILMYHTHCQRIFDTIIRGTLDEAYQFLQHFWQGVPSHLTGLLNTNTVVNMVGVCDSILYRTLSSVLMPNVFKRCSEGLIQMIRTFADKLENWIHAALSDVPINLKTVKLKLGRSFCTILRRQMALYQLTHTAQVVLNNCEMMGHIHKDWKRINLGPISKQALFFTEYSNDHVETIKYINEYWENFQDLIERKATIEDFTEKVENTVHFCVVEMSQKKRVPLRRVAKTFILLWHAVGSLISRDMTIHSAVSFGSFHLIQTMFDEYIHYLVEILHSEDVTKYLLKNVALDVLPNLDFTWNGITETNCFDLCDTPSTLPSLTDISDGLDDQNEFHTDSSETIFHGGEYDFAVNQNQSMKFVQPRNDNNYLNNEFDCCNTKDAGLEAKFNSFGSENGQFPEFNGCSSQCVEFSTNLYYQETLQYSTNNSFFQSATFDEATDFDNLD